MTSRASISEATGGERRRSLASSRRHRRIGRHAGGRPRLAIVVQGGTVQGVYAERLGRFTVHLLDDDDLRTDDDLAESVGATGVLPQVIVESGLARAVAEYRTVAARQAERRRVAEAG